jgi:hypothetical protein
LTLLSSVHWYPKIEVNVFTQTVQVREMSLEVQVQEMSFDSSLRRRDVISGLHASSVRDLRVWDQLWESSESFQPDLENIIVALQSNRSLQTISISRDVLAAIGESDQGSLFRSLGNLSTLHRMSVYGGAGISPTVIQMRVFADALSETINGIESLCISGFKVSSRSEVEQLARGLKARVETLVSLRLANIVLDGVEDKTGFLDPILLALAPVGEPCGQLSCFSFSCVKDASNRASVVSPDALGAFFAEEPIDLPTSNRESVVSPEALGAFFAVAGEPIKTPGSSFYSVVSPEALSAFFAVAGEPIETPGSSFYLHNLGLNDNHCEVMAKELARDDALLRPIHALDLTGNPSIGQQGHEALLGLLNRRFDLGAVVVDDQNWKATFDLVVFMNRKHNRGRFLKNGVFPSKEMWVHFLAELAGTDCYCWSEEKKLNAIWYTLREDPDLICT